MPIKNYTTDVAADRSVGAIVALLAQKRARSIHQTFDEAGACSAIFFTLEVAGSPISFQLPANIEGVAESLMRDFPYSKHNTMQTLKQWEAKHRARAHAIAWRILKDWVEAQMAIIESGQVEPAQAFLAYAQQQDGRTMYQIFLETTQARLTDGRGAPKEAR